MALVTLDAVILRSQHYSETSRIVSFYSREKGLIKGIAKGARGPKGRFGSTLEPIQRVRVSLSVKETRDLQTVTQADLLHPFARLREDLFRSTYAQAVVELLGRIVPSEHPSDEIYELLLTVLRAYEERIGDPQLIFLAFQIHLAQSLGYALHLEHCAACGSPIGEGSRVSFPRGSVFCGNCATGEGYSSTISPGVAELGHRLGGPDGIAAAAALLPSRMERQELIDLLRRHLEFHTETSITLRALQIAESLEDYDPEVSSAVDLKTNGD